MTASKRTTATKFKKGQSGNPGGRPKGSKNRATLLAIAAMEGELDSIVRKVIEAAKSGDMTAARLVVDKLIPATKERPIELALPALDDATGCRAAQAAVIQAVAAGNLLPGEAEAVSTLIEHQRKGLETEEIQQRLLAIEDRLNITRGAKP